MSGDIIPIGPYLAAKASRRAKKSPDDSNKPIPQLIREVAYAFGVGEEFDQRVFRRTGMKFEDGVLKPWHKGAPY